MSFTAAMPRLSAYTRDLRDSSLHTLSLSFVRYLSILHEQQWPYTPTMAVRTFLDRHERDPHKDIVARAEQKFFEKAAVGTGTTTDASWAGSLAVVKPLAEGFIQYAYATAVIGQLPLRTVPFNSSLPVQSTPGVYGWVGENKVKPITRLDFGTATVSISKAQAIIVVTNELLRAAAPGTDQYLRDALAAGLSEFLDKQFLDLSVTAIAGTRPASVTNGASVIAPTGTTSAALVKDVGALLAAYFTANPDGPAGTRLIMTPAHAAMLAGATNSPTLTMEGGSYQGVGVVTSASAGTAIVALDAGAILLASGGIEFDTARQGSLQMSDAPVDPVTAAEVQVSLWQTNCTGLRVEHFINYTRTRTSAVKVLSPCAYVPGS
jgi:hypothetical protein